MRELTKSLSTFSWAMTLFSIQQLGNLMSMGQSGKTGSAKATQAFDAVTCCAESQLGEMLKQTFQSGDQMQRSMVDMMFGMFGMAGMKPQGQASGMGSGMASQDGWGCCQGGQAPNPAGDSTGWGPMPPGKS